MALQVASYMRRGFTMSRRAYISHKNNEHPISYWETELGLNTKTLKKMLVCIGIHHTGLYAKRTLFYRLPRLHRDHELEKFFKVFNTIPPTKKKFIARMAEYLQEDIDSPRKHKAVFRDNIQYKRKTKVIEATTD